MNYPGNPSLADEIQQKILSTFLQTLDLAEEGRKEEALLGCDFVRRLDPLFKPAEALLERLEAQDGVPPVDDLRVQLAESSEAAPSPAADEIEVDVDDIFAAIEQPDETSDGGIEASEVFADVSSAFDSDDGGTAPAEPAEPPSPELPPEPESQHPQLEPEPEPEPASDPLMAAMPEPAAVLDNESEERVEQLLAEGQSAFEQAEYQSAIDAWSRIFLIDIDHPEANRRIELARKLKAEVERKVEESYHDALTALDGGNLETATDGFRKVLKLQPSHLAAQEHLDRLTATDFVPEEDTPLDPVVADLAPLPDSDTRLQDSGATDIPESEFGFEPLTPPSLGAEFEREAPSPSPPLTPARKSSRRSVFVIAGLVLVVALVTAWFLRSNWTRLFPNAGEEVVAPQTPRVDPIVRAQGLHMGGNTAMAISQLRRLPPAHPKYAEAQALIAQWETVLEDDADEGPSPEQVGERDRLVALARESFANREFLSAEEFFTLASQAAPLDTGAEALQVETLERLAPLRSDIEIFRQGEWGYALRSLWRRHEEEPGNPDILRLMVDSYFNLGVRDLQRSDTASAAENLGEAASLAPDDAEVQRLLEFSRTYGQRAPDLQYRIFVKYLPFR